MNTDGSRNLKRNAGKDEIRKRNTEDTEKTKRGHRERLKAKKETLNHR
jgi:hypothetical protein